MPSQITHYLFANEVFEKSLGDRGKRYNSRYPELIAWCSQGPDFFYHNQRTRPGAFKYGRIVHRSGYGSMLFHMLPFYFSAQDENREVVAVILYSFLTHAVLDRFVHPYIIFFSGWREPGKKETVKYYRMHAFFERIIDRMMCGTHDFDFHKTIQKITVYMNLLCDVVVTSIRKTYTTLHKPDLNETRFANAFADAFFFYKVTNMTDRENVRYAYERDKQVSFTKKLLALYYPRYFDRSIDYLNSERREWNDPFHPALKSTKSFIDLYTDAVQSASAMVKDLDTFLRKRSAEDIREEEIVEIVGNGNLSNGEMNKSAVPLTAQPLPLFEQLICEYQGVEREFNLDEAFVREQSVEGTVHCL